MKRKLFLDTFLKALGAVKIIWGDITVNKICETAIYDEFNPDERQDFVWHITEDNVPSEDVRKLIEYLTDNKLIDIDKINKPFDELNLDFIEESQREIVINKLFSIEVKMVDSGEETDSYFIHN